MTNLNFKISELIHSDTAVQANDLIAIARSGDFVWLPTAEAITVGSDLYFNESNEVTSSGSGSIVGTAWSTAAAGDMVKVLLNFQQGGN